MRIARVARYAAGKSPVMGIPVFSIAEGAYITAVFRRAHVQAALEAGALKAHYDERTHVLELNGSKRACYRLKNLNSRHGGSLQTWILKDELASWAQSRRKSATTRALPLEERKIAKLRDEIGRLERKQKKVSVYLPPSPLIREHRETEGESARRYESRWREQKALRRSLGQLVQSSRKSWAQFYRDVEALIGRSVSAGSRHDRVCKRKGGPDRIEYLQQLYKHVGLASKPWRQEWQPYELGWGELNRFQRHRAAQMKYLMAMNERANLAAQIQTCQEEILELQREQLAPLPPAPSHEHPQPDERRREEPEDDVEREAGGD